MKNIFKITAIITALLFTLLASGCGETQEEKYNKLEKQYAKIVQENVKWAKEKAKPILDKNTGGKVADAQTDEKLNQLIKEQYKKLIKESEPILKEMEKIAKGNPKLEGKIEAEKNQIEFMKKTIKKIEEGKMTKLPWNQ